MSQYVLNRIHASRQVSQPNALIAPIQQQQPVSGTLTLSSTLSTPHANLSSSLSHKPSTSQTTNPSTPHSNISNLPANPSKSSTKRPRDSLPGAIISIEDHLRSQLRQAKARIGLLEAELKKNNITTLTEHNQTLATKLRLANNKINELEDENLRLSQTERQVLSTERILERTMSNDPSFLLRLHDAKMKLLNPNPPRNLKTMSRRLQRKQARMNAYNGKKAVDELLNEPKTGPSPIDSPRLQISLTPVYNPINIDLDE